MFETLISELENDTLEYDIPTAASTVGDKELGKNKFLILNLENSLKVVKNSSKLFEELSKLSNTSELKLEFKASLAKDRGEYCSDLLRKLEKLLNQFQELENSREKQLKALKEKKEKDLLEKQLIKVKKAKYVFES